MGNVPKGFAYFPFSNSKGLKLVTRLLVQFIANWTSINASCQEPSPVSPAFNVLFNVSSRAPLGRLPCLPLLQ